MSNGSTAFFSKIKGNNAYVLADSLDDRKRLTIQVKVFTPVFKQAIGLALDKAGLWTKLRDPKATFHILDLGCGEGLYLPILHQYLLERGAKAHLKMVGIDLDSTAVATAQEYMTALGLRHARFYLHDATMPLTKIEGLSLVDPSSHFDLIFASALLMHLRNPQATLHYIYEVLQPGGAFYTKDMSWSWDNSYPSPAFTRIIHLAQQATLKMLGVDFAANPKSFLQVAGFESIESFEDRYAVGGHTESGRRMLENLLLVQHAVRATLIQSGVISAREYDGLMEQEFREISPELEGRFSTVNTIARRPLH
ncbi:MAG: class I SAM-dependent methyltransferase [Chloroflexota bacterium]